MIDLGMPNVLVARTSTIKETSYDETNKTYMSQCNLPATNFDKVKDSYNGRSSTSFSALRSIDALLLPRNYTEKFVFIEFKNGQIQPCWVNVPQRCPSHTIQRQIYNQEEILKINEKAYESLLLLNEILQENLSFDKKEVVFILVYNHNKNSLYAHRARLAKKAKKTFFITDFKRLRNLFFRVETIDERDFLSKTNQLTQGLYPF